MQRMGAIIASRNETNEILTGYLSQFIEAVYGSRKNERETGKVKDLYHNSWETVTINDRLKKRGLL